MGLGHPSDAKYEGLSGIKRRTGFGTRLIDLGLTSLGGLLVGGVLLMLVGVNSIRGDKDKLPNIYNKVITLSDQNEDFHRFLTGETWSVQTWIAIIGIAFTCLFHGVHEAYHHLFDWWCSRQARTTGLDYGRYLNAQSRAPVTWGFRGFPVFAVSRYVLLVASLAASIGYKFGVGTTTVPLEENVNPSKLLMGLKHAPRPFTALGEPSPWFQNTGECFFPTYARSDRDDYNISLPEPFDFTSKGGPDFLKPPVGMLMVGSAVTRNYLTNTGWRKPGQRLAAGWMASREVVAVASMTEEDGNFTMSREEGENWYRVRRTNNLWTDRDEEVVVEYRILEHNKVQVQWASAGSWLTDDDSEDTDQIVSQRITYSMRYGTAEVFRDFQDSGLPGLMGGIAAVEGSTDGAFTVFKTGRTFPTVTTDNNFLDMRRNWIDAQVTDPDTTVSQGVNAIIQAIMYEWAYQDIRAGRGDMDIDDDLDIVSRSSEGGKGEYEGEYLRLLPAEEYPFGDEDQSKSERHQRYSDFNYPFFKGQLLDGATGCHPAAARVFVTIGAVALSIMLLRIFVGPPELTSWTAQHIYLSQIGIIPDLQKSEDLATGYEVAPADLGRLKLHL